MINTQSKLRAREMEHRTVADRVGEDKESKAKRKTNKISFDLAAQIGRSEKKTVKEKKICANTGTKSDRNDKVIFCFCVWQFRVKFIICSTYTCTTTFLLRRMPFSYHTVFRAIKQTKIYYRKMPFYESKKKSADATSLHVRRKS